MRIIFEGLLEKDNEDIVTNENEEAISTKINSNLGIPKGIINKCEDDLIIDICKKFSNNIPTNNLLLDKGAILLADNNGIVYTTILKNNFQFLKKESTTYFDFSLKSIGVNAIGLATKYKEPFIINSENHFLDILKGYNSLALLLTDDKGQEIVTLGYITDEEINGNTLNLINDLVIGFNFSITEYKKNIRLENDANKREALLTISQILYSTFDVNEVLIEAVKNINLFYPNDELEILMTQDYIIPNAKIKRLSLIPDKDEITGKAFLEGRVIVNKRRNNDQKGEFAVPLKGKQGVYGVIHLLCTGDFINSNEKIHFLTSIASIIGNAFENARLYQQSNNLVEELKIINQLTKRLNESLDKESILNFVVNESLKLFNANYVFVLEVDSNKETLTGIASNNEEIIGEMLHINYGYFGIVYNNREATIITDIDTDKTLDEDLFIKRLGCKSLIAVPILVGDRVLGILAVSSKEKNHFSYDNYRMIQLLSKHLGLALTNALLHETIKQNSITDYLTKLYNRSYLDKKIEESINIDEKGSILLFDIDNFKNVNDTYGHQVGDKVLVQIANIIKTNIRDGDVPVRWGGEELALYLPNIDIDIAVKIAERILYKIRTETEPPVTASCGVATWMDNNVDNLSLIRNADKALYEAKNNGKNQVKVNNDEII